MIFYLIAVLGGILIASMLPMNGILTDQYGIYLGTLMIHLIGLFPLVIYAVIKRKSLHLPKGVKVIYLLGGFTGVLTTVFNNVAFGVISMTSIIALSLLGQTITSLLIDHFGWFEMKKRAFPKQKWIGLAFVILGTIVMIW